jgi:mono/diheme cytochrome c family protein
MKLKVQGKTAVGVAALIVIVFGCKPRNDESRTLDAGADSDEVVSWVDNRPVTDWDEEIKKRDKAIYDYLRINDSGAAQRYGFTNGHTPAIAWKWFEDSPVGFGGVPYVLWKTIAMLEDNEDYYTRLASNATEVAKRSSLYTDLTSSVGAPTPKFDLNEIAALRAVARLWHQPSPVSGERNLDHIGLLPHPGNYRKSGDSYSPTFQAVQDPRIQKELLPYGMTYESGPGSLPTESKAKLLKELSGKVSGFAQVKTKLAINKFVWEKRGYNESEDDKPETFGKPSKYDNVFFSCAACHVGRVVTEDGGIRHMYGAPNTEIEAQYYSQILRDTAALLVTKGFDPKATTFQGKNEIEPNKTAVVALAKAMIMSVMVNPGSFYGKDEDSERRAYHQAMQVLDNFGGIMKEIIGTGIKTHYIYNVVAGKNYYGNSTPDLLNNRVGQMDAFGIASGLLAIHSFRTSFKSGNKTTAPGLGEFMYIINPDSPFFKGFDGLGDSATLKGMESQDLRASSKEALIAKTQEQIRNAAPKWAPPGPAPIDIKSLNWAKDRKLANWDGNQGAAARTLASGTSATGDPRKVNVRIHEPLNPLIENLPPPPYPFQVDLAKAKEGKKLFKESCTGCHKPNNDEIYPAASLGVDKWRSMTNTPVSRHGMAAIVLEACFYYMRNNRDSAGGNGMPGTDRDWCLPKNLQGKWGSNLAEFNSIQNMTKEQYEMLMDDYFKDTPKRVQDGVNGYKADMLHGVWSNAPYLHNGSVPTLVHLLCENTRPKTFIRGNINYDQDLGGFVWWEKPKRYNKYDMANFKTFDTTKTGWSNKGHTFGKQYCGAVGKLDSDASHSEVAAAVKQSPELSSLLEYLKTL